MPTTHRRINVTLTDAEEQAFRMLTTEGTPQHAALAGHFDLAHPSVNIDAELVHLVLAVGLKGLEAEALAASYAAEAAAYTEEDRALAVARRRRYVERDAA